MRPWSTAFRIPTDRGQAWLKATGPGPAYEGPLLDVFAARGDPPCPVAARRPPRSTVAAARRRRADPPPDALRTARATTTSRRGGGSSPSTRNCSGRSNRTTPSRRCSAPARRTDVPRHSPGSWHGCSSDDAWWERLTDEEREEGAVARRTLRDQLPVVTALADELAALGIAASVQHDDLHGGNVLVGPDGDRFFDWGDAVVAHPFGTLTVTFNSIAHTLELPPADPAFTRLEAVYLEAWHGVASPADLQRAAAIARVARLYRPGAGLGALAQRARG